MKNLLFISLTLMVLLGAACDSKTNSESGSPEKQTASEAPSELDTEDETKSATPASEAEEEEEFVYDEVEMPIGAARSWESFIPRGYEVLDTAFGDLDRNGSDDVLIVCKSEAEPDMMGGSAGDLKRPVILLTQQPNGQIGFAARNDNVVLCQQCGGMFDPFDKAVVKNGYFTLEHYGGSGWRWSRFITFKYDEARKDWFLHKDGGDSYHTGDPENVETAISTKADFGDVKFVDFNAEG